MTFDGSTGLIVIAVVAVLFFGLLIVGLAWMYGRQSPKGQKETAELKGKE
jgi:hypothetical protein